MNALIEFATLARSHPGPDAPTGQVVANAVADLAADLASGLVLTGGRS